MVKGIFLDLGWTVFRPVNGDWFIIPKMLEFATLEGMKGLAEDRRNAAFDKAFRYLNDHHLLSSIDEEFKQFKTFYGILAAELPELGVTAEQAAEMAASKVFDADIYVFFEKSRETIFKLKSRYRLGIISDTWPSSDRILRSGGVLDLFDCKTYSCHLGVWKPDPKMYLHALEQMGLPAEQTVFVDDWEPNLDGAAACGIHPVLIKTRSDAVLPGQRFSENTVDSGKYPAIRAIEELPDLLEKGVFHPDRSNHNDR